MKEKRHDMGKVAVLALLSAVTFALLFAICTTTGIHFAMAAEPSATAATYDELVAAIDAAPTDGTQKTITIAGDIAFPQGIEITAGKNIRLVDDGTARTCTPAARQRPANTFFLVDEGASLVVSTSSADDSLLTFDDLNKSTVQNLQESGDITVRGTFTLEGGTFTNCNTQFFRDGVIAVFGNGSFTMNGGTLSGNDMSYADCGIVFVTNNASFTMNGGKISNNTGWGTYCAPVLICALNGQCTFEMNGGEVSGNSGFGIGGVLVGGSSDFSSTYATDIATATFNGGVISGNTATFTGGGIAVLGNGKCTINDIAISGNVAPHGGGIAAYDYFKNYESSYPNLTVADYERTFNRPAALTINGGVISNNEAQSSYDNSGTGGGIYIATNQAVINACTITNNTASRQGGGLYVASTPYVAHVYKLLVTQNTASIIGGGIWCCPTGDAEVMVTNGGAIFGNTAAEAGNDIATVPGPSTNRTHVLTLGNRMLGGGSVAWYKDGEVYRTSDSDQLGNGQGERFAGVEGSSPVTGLRNSTESWALASVTSDEAESLAAANASVIITGNSAPRGGGIGTNGGVVVGGTPEGDADEWKLVVNKTWGNVEEADRKPVTVRLVINGTLLDEAVLSQDNNWSATFDELPDPNTLVAGSITVEEEGNDYVATYSNPVINENERTIQITIENNSPLRDIPTPDEPDAPDTPETPEVTETPSTPEPTAPSDEPVASDTVEDVQPETLAQTGDSAIGILALVGAAIASLAAAALAFRNLPRRSRK